MRVTFFLRRHTYVKAYHAKHGTRNTVLIRVGSDTIKPWTDEITPHKKAEPERTIKQPNLAERVGRPAQGRSHNIRLRNGRKAIAAGGTKILHTPLITPGMMTHRRKLPSESTGMAVAKRIDSRNYRIVASKVSSLRNVIGNRMRSCATAGSKGRCIIMML